MAEKQHVLCVLRLLYLFIFLGTCTGSSPFFYRGTDELTEVENNLHHVNLKLQSAGIKFPFYGTNYDDLYISKDGMIGFTPDTGYNNIVLGSPTLLVSVDKPFIAPFRYSGLGRAETLAGGKAYNGRIYYNVLTGDMNEQLQNITEIIRNSVVGASEFDASWGLIVTWQDVISSTDAQNCPNDQGPCPTNSFQAAVITDGNSSYAIFNYEKMDIGPPTKFQTGFNAGRGRGWTRVMDPSKLANANTGSGSDVLGRYIYKISEEDIIWGGCASDSPLEIYPNYAGMLGGSMIEFSGLCLKPTDQIMCRFGSGDMTQTSYGGVLTGMKGRCVVPTLSERGIIEMSVSTNVGSTYSKSSTITIAPPDRTPQFIKTSNDWLTTSPNTLTVTWDNNSLLSNNTNAQISISLIGYKETQSEVKWQKLETLGENIPLKDKTYSFNVDNHGCRDSFCGEYDVGYIELSLVHESEANMYRAFTSKLMPLGWYNKNFMIDQYGENWPSQKCDNWVQNDLSLPAFKENMISCPCTLKQAVADIGRFQPVKGCNMFRPKPNMCKYHEGSIHCVRSVQPTIFNTRNEGAGNQCCYDKDGLLKYAADTFDGSSSDRSHDFGTYPYKSYGNVPQASHWVHDVVPFYYCCMWTNFDDCDKYMDLRPTVGCNDYKAPSAAAVFGQGHVITLTGDKFRMCGEGDFLLLQGHDFVVQGRFQFSAHNGPHQEKSVILTHVAVKTQTETIEIRLRHPSLDKSQTLLDVLVNNEYKYFKTKPMMWQDFKESTVVCSREKGGKMHSNFTIILKNGIGIQVADKQDIMFLTAMIPPMEKDSVSGILTQISDHPNHDHSKMNADKMNFAEMTQHFQNHWSIRHQHASVIPHAIVVDNTTNLCTNTFDPTTNEHLCNNTKECQTDLRITGNVQAALYTQEASSWVSAMRSYLQQPVRTCGHIDVPRSTKSNYNYTLGSTVEITGCRTGSLKGPTTYSCDATGDTTQSWYPSVTASCLSGDVEQANVGMIVGIIIAVVVVLIIIIAVGCFIKRRGKSDKRDVAKPEERKYDASYSEVKKGEEPI